MDRSPDGRRPDDSGATRLRGAGGLLQTSIERVDLGEHGRHRLTAQVEHRVLRLALGRHWHGSLALGRRRPLILEITSTAGERAGERYDVEVPRPVDPWPRTARRVLAVAGAGWLALRLVRAAQGRHSSPPRAGRPAPQGGAR